MVGDIDDCDQTTIAERQSDRLVMAVSADEDRQTLTNTADRASSNERALAPTRPMNVRADNGGIGSAAIVAALLYAGLRS